jgi:hypothetical protein
VQQVSLKELEELSSHRCFGVILNQWNAIGFHITIMNLDSHVRLLGTKVPSTSLLAAAAALHACSHTSKELLVDIACQELFQSNADDTKCDVSRLKQMLLTSGWAAGQLGVEQQANTMNRGSRVIATGKQSTSISSVFATILTPSCCTYLHS